MTAPMRSPADGGARAQPAGAHRGATARPPAPANVLAVASGKGGVGKTFLSITLAHALADLGERCLLFDGDLGLANVDIQLGLGPTADLASAVTGRRALEDVVHPVEATGFDVVAGRSGSGGLGVMAPAQLELLGNGLRELAGRFDRVVMDLGAGIGRPVRTLASHAGIGLVVTDDEPTALTDAYAYIKVVKQQTPGADLRVVVNMAPSLREGERSYATLRRACETFLQQAPPLLGVVRRDERVRHAIRRQTPLLARYPDAIAAEDVRAIARRLPGSG